MWLKEHPEQQKQKMKSASKTQNVKCIHAVLKKLSTSKTIDN